MADDLIIIEGVLKTTVAVPPEDLARSTNADKLILTIRLMGLTVEDVAELGKSWISSKKYRLELPNEIISDAIIVNLAFDPPTADFGVILHKDVTVSFQYEG